MAGVSAKEILGLLTIPTKKIKSRKCGHTWWLIWRIALSVVAASELRRMWSLWAEWRCTANVWSVAKETARTAMRGQMMHG